LSFIVVTVVLVLSLSIASAFAKRKDIEANWDKYRNDPLYIFAAPLFKPDNDPRSRIQFATDNFADVLQGILTKSFTIFMEPVFRIFSLVASSLDESATGIFNLRALLAKMWEKFNSMISIFMRRFYNVFHQLRMTNIKLYESFKKAHAIATSSVFAGISLIKSILNSFNFMMTIAIVILITLIVMVIFLFFVLAPTIPLILSVIGLISATAMGGAVGGMSSTFCFTADTPIKMATGITVPIENITIGNKTATGGTIVANMHFTGPAEDLYNLYGITVSASHIVYTDNGPIHVAMHPDAIKVETKESVDLYCLITSDHKIPVITSIGTVLFADWEELDNIGDLYEWTYNVYSSLNETNCPYEIPTDIINSESAYSAGVLVITPEGHRNIHEIQTGDIIYDGEGKLTTVLGCINILDSEIKQYIKINDDQCISAATWLKYGTEWRQAFKIGLPVKPNDRDVREVWYNLITTSGTFKICIDTQTVISVRDFTDIGVSDIEGTYEWVINKLWLNDRE